MSSVKAKISQFNGISVKDTHNAPSTSHHTAQVEVTEVSKSIFTIIHFLYKHSDFITKMPFQTDQRSERIPVKELIAQFNSIALHNISLSGRNHPKCIQNDKDHGNMSSEATNLNGNYDDRFGKNDETLGLLHEAKNQHIDHESANILQTLGNHGLYENVPSTQTTVTVHKKVNPCIHIDSEADNINKNQLQGNDEKCASYIEMHPIDYPHLHHSLVICMILKL